MSRDLPRLCAPGLWIAASIGLAACTADELSHAAYDAAKASCARSGQVCSVNGDTGAPVSPRSLTLAP